MYVRTSVGMKRGPSLQSREIPCSKPYQPPALSDRLPSLLVFLGTISLIRGRRNGTQKRDLHSSSTPEHPIEPLS